MVGRVKTATVTGICAEMIEVEADMSPGLPDFNLTGNLGTIAREARERVRTALKNTGIILNPAKYTINLAPAYVRKEGGHFDLAIAVGMLVIVGLVEPNCIDTTFFAGELSLDGQVNPVNAILPMVACAKENGCTRAIIPIDNAGEGAYVEGIEIIGVSSLSQCMDYLTEKTAIGATMVSHKIDKTDYGLDFSEVRGQTGIKRAAMVAAASLHNLFMIGPPGAGKTMIASRIPTILPEMTDEECMDVSKVYSVAGLLKSNRPFITTRPFRAPHHICTPTALAGGGRIPTPGEMSLADHGVLFLDEFNLFSLSAIETLRQPLENHRITVTRVNGVVDYPADFMLVAAMNPCKCGYYPDRSKCHCTPADIRQYFGKISRPILDRFDICIQVPKASFDEVSGYAACGNEAEEKELTSQAMRKTVKRVMNLQKERYQNCGITLNSQLTGELMKRFCPMTKEAESFLRTAYFQYDLSARSYHRLVRVARTIADLNNCETISEAEICEAIAYKMI